MDSKTAQDAIDGTAENLQSGIRSVRDSANCAADKLSDKVERTADQAQGALTYSKDLLQSTTQRARATANDIADSVVSYAKDNPVSTMLISAGIGALLAMVATALLPSRD